MDQINTTLRESMAEALWQAESVRASDRRRLTAWVEEGEDTREKWRFMADAALVVVQTVDLTDELAEAIAFTKAQAAKARRAGWGELACQLERLADLPAQIETANDQ